MMFLRTHYKEVLFVLFISAIFFATRLYQLTSLPIFTDEAIYIRWAQIATDDPAWRFISLTDGKQPLFIWFVMVAMRLVKDPIFAGRIVSVFAGFGTAIGLFFFTKELFRNYRIGLIASLLYVVFPMALVYDRLALYDSLVGTFAIWSLYVAIVLVRGLRLDTAFILAFAIGAGLLTKTSAFFSIAFLPLTLLLFNWKKDKRITRLIRWGMLAALASIISYVYYSILRLSPFFGIIGIKNETFLVSFSHWRANPFESFFGNTRGLFEWAFVYSTLSGVFLLVTGIFFGKKYVREIVLLILCCVIPIGYLAFFGKVLYPRFIFFMLLYLLPVAAFGAYSLFAKVKKPYMQVLLGLLLLAIPVRSGYYVLTDFSNAPIPANDLDQFKNGWPAGGGVRRALAFFKKKAEEKPIYVATQGTFGLLPYAFEIYLRTDPLKNRIKVVAFWPIERTIPSEVLAASKKMPTYFVFYQPCSNCPSVGEAPKSWKLKPVFKRQKGIGDSYLTIYKVGTIE